MNVDRRRLLLGGLALTTLGIVPSAFARVPRPTLQLVVPPEVVDPKDVESAEFLAISPGGGRAVSLNRRGLMLLWDLRNGSLLQAIQGLDLTSAAFVSERELVTGGSDGRIRVWDLDKATTTAVFGGGSAGRIISLALSPNGEQLLVGRAIALGSMTQQADLFDLRDQRHLMTLSPAAGPVRSVAIHPERPLALVIDSGLGRRRFWLWDLERPTLVREFRGHQEWVNAVAFVPGGDRVVSVGNDGELLLWDMNTARLLHRTITHDDRDVIAVACGPKGRWAFTAGEDERVLAWDLSKSPPRSIPLLQVDGRLKAFALAPQGTGFLTGSTRSGIQYWAMSSFGDQLEGLV